MTRPVAAAGPAIQAAPRHVSTSRLLSWISGALLLLGLLVIVLYAADTPGRPLRYISVGILAAIAALVTGCLLGFLFGIPKVVSSGDLRVRRTAPSQETTTQTPDTKVTTSLIQPGVDGAPSSGGDGSVADAPGGAVDIHGGAASTHGGAANSHGGAANAHDAADPPLVTTSPFEPSTNLAEVSDWLTKLLLGAGLVGLTHLGGPIGKLINMVALGLTRPVPTGAPDNTAQLMGGALLITYLVLGFLDGYVVTTLWYGSKVRQA